MKLLLDHNLDRRFKNHLIGHEISTAFDQGWSDLSNGELLIAAENAGFDVMLTADANIAAQQNWGGRRISILVLRAYDNRRTTHLEMISEFMESLDGIGQGTIVEVLHPAFTNKPI